MLSNRLPSGWRTSAQYHRIHPFGRRLQSYSTPGDATHPIPQLPGLPYRNNQISHSSPLPPKFRPQGEHQLGSMVAHGYLGIVPFPLALTFYGKPRHTFSTEQPSSSTCRGALSCYLLFHFHKHHNSRTHQSTTIPCSCI